VLISASAEETERLRFRCPFYHQSADLSFAQRLGQSRQLANPQRWRNFIEQGIKIETPIASSIARISSGVWGMNDMIRIA
jgi:hypothetical protein